MQLSDDERELFKAAREYQDLKNTAGWRRLVEAITWYIGCKQAELNKDAKNWSVWVASTAFKAFLDEEVDGTISNRDDLIRDVLTQRGLEPQEIESFIHSFHGDNI